MQFSIDDSRSGKKHLHVDRNEYALRRINKKGAIHWQCVRRGCSGSASTFNNTVQLRVAHTCDVSGKRLIKEKMRRRCDSESVPVPQIYEEELCKAVAGGMNISGMHFDSVKSSLYRQRNHYIPTLPITLDDVNVPQEWQVDNVGNQFLRFTSPMPNKMLVFVTERGLNELASCDHWNVDGTFKTA
ncbi:unnamed protein product, partial [Didymodactylos carnosus]